MQGEYAQSREYYREALKTFEAKGNRYRVAVTTNQLGVLSSKLGDIDQAIACFRKAMEIHEATGDRDGMAGACHNLGVMAQDRSDYDQALTWYQKALTIFEGTGNRPNTATSLSQIGILYTLKGDVVKAIPFTLKSYKIHHEMHSAREREDLHWLKRQCEVLGKAKFERVLKESSDKVEANLLFQLIAIDLCR